jgi:hypothetical protein
MASTSETEPQNPADARKPSSPAKGLPVLATAASQASRTTLTCSHPTMKPKQQTRAETIAAANNRDYTGLEYRTSDDAITWSTWKTFTKKIAHKPTSAYLYQLRRKNPDGEYAYYQPNLTVEIMD